MNSDFCPLHIKLMWGYCLRAEKKKKENVKLENVPQDSGEFKRSLIVFKQDHP